ncbi:hypothetical protein XENOCAPTIV_015784, partial [Xenoophorus captivus]
QQEAILEDLRTDIPVHFNFLFSDSHVEVISGKQEDLQVLVVVTPCFIDLSRLLGEHVGETAESPLLDPCLPTDLQDEIGPSTQRLHLRGTGDFNECRQILQPFLNRTNESQTSLSGIFQPTIDYSNSQFYGFSEFYYCMEDVLRMGGDYNASKYAQAAKNILGPNLPGCGIFVFSSRDIPQDSLKGAHSHWRHSFSFVNNHYLFLMCFFIVLLSIILYLLRLRRIHRRVAQRYTPSSVPWLEEGLGSPSLPIDL